MSESLFPSALEIKNDTDWPDWLVEHILSLGSEIERVANTVSGGATTVDLSGIEAQLDALRADIDAIVIPDAKTTAKRPNSNISPKIAARIFVGI